MNDRIDQAIYRARQPHNLTQLNSLESTARELAEEIERLNRLLDEVDSSGAVVLKQCTKCRKVKIMQSDRLLCHPTCGGTCMFISKDWRSHNI